MVEEWNDLDEAIFTVEDDFDEYHILRSMTSGFSDSQDYEATLQMMTRDIGALLHVIKAAAPAEIA